MRKAEFLHQIETLEIQGATSVARETLRFAVENMEEASDAAVFVNEIRDAVLEIRPTEPMLDNLADVAVNRIEQGGDAETVLEELVGYVDELNETIARENVDVFDGTVNTVLTHCHSSTAEALIIKGFERSNLSVYATETRPKYQGRTTAKNLVEHEVDTTLIVDSAVYDILEDVDAVIVGADAITKEYVYNKIGTSQIAYLANAYDVPFYVATSLLKYTEEEREIEQRDADEVWKNRPPKLNVLNPAFDKAPLEHVNGLCTERGMVSAGDVVDAAGQVRNEL